MRGDTAYELLHDFDLVEESNFFLAVECVLAQDFDGPRHVGLLVDALTHLTECTCTHRITGCDTIPEPNDVPIW